MKKIILVALSLSALTFVSCAKTADYKNYMESNNEKPILLYTTQEGVKVYRFYDRGRYRYFCTGNGYMLGE